jgi:thioesterase domain-containing protein
MRAEELEAYIHEHVPLTLAMGITAREAGPEAVVLAAPLARNLNHKRTGFGGSLSALATITAWATAFLCLRARNVRAEIVIRRGEMRYLKAVEQDFHARASFPDPLELQAFLHALQRRGIARLDLPAQLYVQDQLCAEFQGEYVAVLEQR